MTAGSIELFPIRVAPMGVPPPASIPANPSLISKQRVCRNLFGRVEPGSAEAERRSEEQSKLKELKKRYDIDLTANPRGLPEEKLNSIVKLPSLIEQEMQEHQKRLALIKQNDDNNDNDEGNDDDDDENKEKCNSTAEKLRENAETTPQPHRSTGTNATNLSTCGSKHRNHSHDGHLGSQTIRSQPYARQKLISECFTTRRKPILQHSLSKHWPDLWEESAASGMLLLNTSTSSSTTESVSSNSIQQQKKT